ncbi:hypothetical protein FB45DRAFT_1008410 [Roridomyces roridus]|uniref:Uncharacterized protein n=1 Tax=Roridomyces roridus TaxID=1738132 RepID=A0AAD7BBC8_9AGAR|nr:hypothetical protein FB45DRAFT_1008410 [Roridomyces roridus]
MDNIEAQSLQAIEDLNRVERRTNNLYNLRDESQWIGRSALNKLTIKQERAVDVPRPGLRLNNENWEDEGKQREVALTPSVHERVVESVGNKLCIQSAFSFNQGNNNAPRQTHGTKRAVNGERAVMYGTYSRSNTYLNRSHSFISNLHPVSTNAYTEVIDSMKESGGSETLPGGTPQEFPSKQPIRPEGGFSPDHTQEICTDR